MSKKVLIVDDELFILNSIKASISWDMLGIDQFFCSSNGIDALQVIVDEEPDIVITDIRMPGIDGLELIRQAKLMHSDAIFILLSGFQEFEYARTAMQYGVRNYLVKPVTKEVLEEALKEALITLQKEAKRDKEFLTLRRQTVKLQIRQAILTALESERLTENILPDANYQLIYVHFLERNCLHSFLENLHAISDCDGGILYVNNVGIMICEESLGFLSEKQGKHLEVMHMVGQHVTPSIVMKSYSKGSDLLEDLIPRIRRYSSIFLLHDDENVTEIRNYGSVFQNAAISVEDLSVGDGMIGQYMDTMKNFEDVELAKIFAFRIMNSLQVSNGLLPEFMKQLPNMKSCDEIRIYLEHYLTQVLYQKNGMPYRNFIVKTIQIAKDRLNDPNLSLKRICEEVLYMNTDYVSREFYQETGEKFSAYLLRIRMEKAKQLLDDADSESRVYDIAEAVGCSNSTYFCQLFRKYTGMTPSKYMKRNHERGLK